MKNDEESPADYNSIKLSSNLSLLLRLILKKKMEEFRIYNYNSLAPEILQC